MNKPKRFQPNTPDDEALLAEKLRPYLDVAAKQGATIHPRYKGVSRRGGTTTVCLQIDIVIQTSEAS